MPIILSELKFYRSQVVGDGGTNGGPMSANEIISGAAANVFVSVSQTERAAGSVKYRKIFLAVKNALSIPLEQTKVFLDLGTPGEDVVTFFPATQTDTQADITGTEKQYGSGVLNANIAPGAVSMVVDVEDGAAPIFAVADVIRVTDQPTVFDAGSEEFVTVDSVVFVADQATIGFSPPIENNFLSSVTRVETVFDAGSVAGDVDALVVTTASDGDFAFASGSPNSIGSVEQNWLLTFTSPTVFNIEGDTLGSVGAGNIGAGASPNNPAFSEPYFVLDSGGFSGAFAIGDTIAFHTKPAAVAVWMKRVVPAGAAVQSGNKATIAFKGETS